MNLITDVFIFLILVIKVMFFFIIITDYCYFETEDDGGWNFDGWLPTIRQGLLNRWTSQLDLGCTTGGVRKSSFST